MRSILIATASVVMLAAPWAFLACPAAAMAHSAGALTGGGVHRGGVSGPRGPFHRLGDQGRLHRERRWGASGFGERIKPAETGVALGWAAALADGYADYYGDYEALPLVAPDYGYPSAFDNRRWPYSSASNPYRPQD